MDIEATINLWARALAGVLADHAPLVIRATRLTFFILAALFLLSLWRRAETGRGARPARAGLFYGIALGLIGIALYQATWQLAGFVRPEFIAFMRKHSHRAHNPARDHARGRILDQHGVVLAADRVSGAGPRRHYPLGPAAAHLVGYADPMYGLTGIEAADDRSLSGAGREALADWRGFGQGLLDHQRTGGNDLTLTLDARLQARAMALLAGRPGAVVGLRPADGAVLILASSPGFDPNAVDPAQLERQPHTPMFHRALRGRYPPGSTFKVLTACLAAEAGFSGTIDCPAAGFTPAGHTRPIRDHEFFEAQRRGNAWRGHGTLTLDEAFARSSNVFFARLGSRYGAEAWNDLATRFALNRGLTLFTGVSGAVRADPSGFPTLRPGQAGEIAQVSIGQGVLQITPIQMALITAAIANDGVMMAPRCRRDAPPEILTEATTAAAAGRVRQLMRGSVLNGTGRGAHIPEVEIAGKTGTAQHGGEKDHSWFVCFAPYRQPALALAVVVEGGGYGSQAALPVAVALMREAAALDWGRQPPPAPSPGDAP